MHVKIGKTWRSSVLLGTPYCAFTLIKRFFPTRMV